MIASLPSRPVGSTRGFSTMDPERQGVPAAPARAALSRPMMPAGMGLRPCAPQASGIGRVVVTRAPSR